MSVSEDQAYGLRRLMANLPDRFIAVLGSGPSAGASSVTRNLAAALSQRGLVVGLQDPAAGWQPDSGEGRITLFDAVSAGVPAQAELIARADCVLVVLEPNPASITRAYSCIKKLQHTRPAQKLLVMLNRADERGAATRILLNLVYTCEHYLTLDLGLAGVVGLDSRVSQAERLNMTAVAAYPDSPAAQDFFGIAERLLQTLSPATGGRPDGPALVFSGAAQRQPLAA